MGLVVVLVSFVAVGRDVTRDALSARAAPVGVPGCSDVITGRSLATRRAEAALMGGEAVEIALGTLLLVTPMLGGFGLIVWSRASAPGSPIPFLLSAIAGALLVAGLVLAVSAPEGFGGVPRVLFGAYLAGVGGVAMLACLAITVQRRRDEGGRAGRSASGDEVSGD